MTDADALTLSHVRPTVGLGLDNRRADAAPSNVSVPDVTDFGRLAQSFDAVGAHNYGGYLTVTGGGEAERVPRLLVTPGYFRVLQATPALGRLFTAEESKPSPPAVAVISDAYWRRRFGADPNVVGQTIMLSGRSVTIVGVLRREFVHPDPRIESAPDVFTLLNPDPDVSGRGGRFVRGIARLAGGVTLEQAESELVALAARLAEEYPASNLGRSVVLRPLSDVAAGDLRFFHRYQHGGYDLLQGGQGGLVLVQAHLGVGHVEQQAGVLPA